VLHGRRLERARLDDLLAGARASRSQALVIRGEPGVGKSALVQWTLDRAPPVRRLQARGVESELELPFATLHQLLYPVLDRVDGLPAVQAAALRGALGMAPGRGGDRFLVAVAVLTLLADVAAERGLVCAVDDAQWGDAASVDALLFVARRLEAEGILLIFAARDGADGFAAPGLPELALSGLDPDSAGALLAESPMRATDRVRARLIEETGGNPLALIELPAALTAAQLAGEESLPVPLPVGAGVERLFAGMAARLPDESRAVLVLAAADDTGCVGVIVKAAAALGIRPGALTAAEASGLVRIMAGRVDFRHPLVRSALYQQAGFAVRRATHRALAEAFDGPEDIDRRAWHLAMAAVEPDDSVATALEESAALARGRAGPAAAAAALQRAAILTTNAGERGRRLVAAAEASWTAGRPTQATTLLDQAEPLVGEPGARAGLLALRGLVELSCGRPETAYPLLVAGAADIANPHTALARLALACEAASLGGGPDRLAELGDLIKALPSDLAQDDLLVLDMLAGVAAAAADDWETGAARLHRVVRGTARGEQPLALLRAGQAALLLGDESAAQRLYLRAAGIARRSGAIGLLATTLDRLAFTYAVSGQLTDAEMTCEEGLRLARELGQQEATAHAVLALIAAWRGAAEDCRRHAEEALAQADARGLGAVKAGASWALGLLELGIGRPDAAVVRLTSVVHGTGSRHLGIALWAVPDLVEAAARAGRPEEGRAALQRFGAWARRVGTPWAIEAARRGAAQLAGGEIGGYVQALEPPDAGRPLDRARTRLSHGEALRRARRRTDARVALRAAMEAFDRAGAVPWAERARAELRATGETVGAPGKARRDRLTPQELQISRLAAGGASNPEIARQLFLSRKTVEYHLHKVFTKLDISGRWELARLDLD
jgi:DNA-binding CsgD family transcriptional regulator